MPLNQWVSVNQWQSAPLPGNSSKIKIWSGTAWVAKVVKFWNGSSWVTKPVKRWNGTMWV